MRENQNETLGSDKNIQVCSDEESAYINHQYPCMVEMPGEISDLSLIHI